MMGRFGGSLPTTAALLAGLASAAMTAAASRPWGLGVLALVAYVPAFVVILSAKRARDGAGVAAIAALGVASVGYEATVGIFPGAYPIALSLALVPVAMAGALSVRFGHASVLRRLPWPWRLPAAAAALVALWCAAELLPARPELLGNWAFPLAGIGYSQFGLPTALLARFSSVSAVSAAVLLVNAALAVLWRATRHGLRRESYAAVATLIFVGSAVALANTEPAAPEAVPAVAVAGNGSPAAARPPEVLRLRLVQPNLRDSSYVAAAEFPTAKESLETTLARLITGDDARAEEVDLTLLPEASWPGVLRAERPSALTTLLDAAGPVLLGAVSSGWSAVDDTRLANSVLLLSDGELTHVYDKRRLVPIAEASLRAGTGPRLVEVGGHEVAPFVCYDIVFPGDVRAAARLGADLLTVHTDDSFAARSDVPALHLRVAAMRAVETGLPVALVGNTGPSAVISAAGKIVAITDHLEATTLTAVTPVALGSTPYVRHGDWVGGTAVALSLGIAAMSVAGGGASELDQGPT